MGKWTDAVAALRQGHDVVLEPHGNSMSGRVESGDRVTLTPCDGSDVSRGDVVLVRVERALFLHLVTEIGPDTLQIGNNKGKINGWVPYENVYGRVIEIEHVARETPHRRRRRQ